MTRSHLDMHVSKTYLRLLCGCTKADWWQLSIGSLAGTLASLPSHNALSQPWVGRTGVGRKKKRFESNHHVGLFLLNRFMVPLWRGWRAC